MRIRVHTETYSGLKPGVYDARKPHYPKSFRKAFDCKGDVFVDKHYVSAEHHKLVPRPASGMGERVMTTTNTLTVASMLSQGFDVRVRDTKTGRFVKWDNDVINTNGSRPATIDYVNRDTTLRYALPREIFKWYQKDKVKREVLNVNGLITFDETYSFAQYDIVHQRKNEYVFEILA